MSAVSNVETYHFLTSMRNYPINRGKSSCFPKPNITVLPPRSDKITRSIFGKAASVLTTCSQNTISCSFSWFYTWYPMISIVFPWFSHLNSGRFLHLFLKGDPWWPAARVTQRHSESWQHVPVGRLTSGFVGRINRNLVWENGNLLKMWVSSSKTGILWRINGILAGILGWEVNQRNLGRQRCGLSKQQEWWVKPCLKGDLRQKERVAFPMKIGVESTGQWEISRIQFMEVRKHTICLGHILLGYSLT